MKYYLDITLLPDAEANLGFLWHKVYQQIHIALVENKTGENQSAIAVSIPHYGNGNGNKDDDKSFPLGNKLRLLAQTEDQLQKLDVTKWLSRLTDYCHYTSIKEVPASVDKFAYLTRKQFKTSVERLARRRAKRKNESYEKALQYFEGFNEQQTKLPFLNMKSLSKGNDFKLFIEQNIVEQSQEGSFTCYGLSPNEIEKQATVPWF